MKYLNLVFTNPAAIVDNGDGTVTVSLLFENDSTANSAKATTSGNFQGAPCKNIDRFRTTITDA